MLQIGLTRWFVQAWEKPQGGGSCQWVITLTPEARYYKNFFDQTIRSAAFMAARPGRVDAATAVKAQACYAMARDLAHELSDWCVLRGIINATEAPLWDGRAYTDILAVCNNGPDEDDFRDEQVEFIDLPEAYRLALLTQQERQTRRRRWEAELVDWEGEAEKRQAAEKRAKQLLANWLTPEERQQAEETGRVTVDSKMGRCIVPINGGQVSCSDGHRYCIIFEDGNLPPADEALMKILLLKTDPETFKQKARQWN